MSEPRTVDQLVDAYFLHYRLTSGTREERHRAMSDACVWAWETVDDLVRESPEDAWMVIQRLIAKAPDESTLAYIGAGPWRISSDSTEPGISPPSRWRLAVVGLSGGALLRPLPRMTARVGKLTALPDANDPGECEFLLGTRRIHLSDRGLPSERSRIGLPSPAPQFAFLHSPRRNGGGGRVLTVAQG